MGCANSLVFVELHRLGLLENKRILVYEPSEKIANDRTFCFWLEPHALQNAGLDTLVSHSWSHAKCTTTVAQELAGKRYYYIRSEALYSKARELLVHYEANWIAQEFEQTCLSNAEPLHSGQQHAEAETQWYTSPSHRQSRQP